MFFIMGITDGRKEFAFMITVCHQTYCLFLGEGRDGNQRIKA